jgi:hypothetical protein
MLKDLKFRRANPQVLRIICSILIICSVFSILLVTPSTTQAINQAATISGSTNQIIAQLATGTNVNTINQAYGTSVAHALKGQNTFLLNVPVGQTADNLVSQMQSDTRLVFAETNARASLTEGAQIYIYLDQSSALQDGSSSTTALSQATNQWAFKQIELSQAQQKSLGTGLTIALIDTGVNAAHSDLTGKILPGYNFLNQSADTNDDLGHGTFVAGLLAQVAPAARILPLKALDNTGWGTVADASDALYYATDQGAKIINISLGTYISSKQLEKAVKYAQSKGALVVASAGNDNSNRLRYPAALSGVVGVAATDQSNHKANFSNYGSAVQVSAPGVGIYSTYWKGGYAYGDGTSFATPQVAGEAALVWSLHPDWRAKDVASQIGTSSNSLLLLDLIYGKLLGQGVIDAYKACGLLNLL